MKKEDIAPLFLGITPNHPYRNIEEVL